MVGLSKCQCKCNEQRRVW